MLEAVRVAALSPSSAARPRIFQLRRWVLATATTARTYSAAESLPKAVSYSVKLPPEPPSIQVLPSVEYSQRLTVLKLVSVKVTV